MSLVKYSSQGRKHSQLGIGLLEVVISVIVFMLFVVLGSKSYRVVSEQHKEAKAIESLSNSIRNTSEGLSAKAIAELADPVNGFTDWSKFEKAGHGGRSFRYRVIPDPLVDGAPGTEVMGLEIEFGKMVDGNFRLEGTHSTLIAPSLAKLALQVDPKVEEAMKASETAYKQQRYKIDKIKKVSLEKNPTYLNSLNCYELDRCCTLIRDWAAKGFQNLDLTDGLAEKCEYRCLSSGSTSIEEINSNCGVDLCDAAGWQKASDCENKFPEGSFQDVLCDQCVGGGGCTGCCDDLERLISQGYKHMPEGFPLSDDCSPECVAKWKTVHHDYHLWKTQICDEEDLCQASPIKDKEQCCQTRGITGAACRSCLGVGKAHQCRSYASCHVESFADNYDCAKMLQCDGTPIPYGWVDAHGDVRKLCREGGSECPTNCHKPLTKQYCCSNHWMTQREKIYCPDLIKNGACCNVALKSKNGVRTQCSKTGHVIATR